MPSCKRSSGIVRVYSDYEMLSVAVAEFFVQRANDAIEDRGRFSVALSGGSTPRKAYSILAGPAFNKRVDWGQVFFFWSDERFVPLNDFRSNARMVHEELLDHVPLSPDHVHPIAGNISASDAALQYESLLRNFFHDGPPRFDLVLLGLGADGHTASLFHGSPAVQESDRWVSEFYNEAEGIHRITLTASILNQASATVFIVSGASKAKILKEVLEETTDPERFPARLIMPECYGGELYWFLDRASAALLGDRFDPAR